MAFPNIPRRPRPLTLRTNLRTLKYGSDQPGYGSSDQPYIQFPLPENASPEILSYYENNRISLDFPIRGGGYNLGSVGPFVSQAAKFDTRRIKKFLESSPQGKLFILKQQGLQLANPKLQVAGQINPDLGVLPFRLPGNLENTRIYNGGKNTLAQVAVQGSGIHFDRHGLVPINPYQQTYIYVADDRKNGVDSTYVNNRLYNLYKTKIATQGRVRLDTQDISIATLNTLGISRNPDLLFQYTGGPDSVGGIGLTTIPRSVNSFIDTTRTNKSYVSQSKGPGPSVEELYQQVIVDNNPTTVYKYKIADSQAYAYSGSTNEIVIPRKSNTTPANPDEGIVEPRDLQYTFNYQQLKAARSQDSIGRPDIKADFRKIITDNSTPAADTIASTEGYDGNNNIATKYGIGNPGSPFLKRVKYNESVDSGAGLPTDITQDKINMLDVGKDTDSAGEKIDDLIKFRFDTIEVDSAGVLLGAAGSTPLVFRAFLTSLQDNHSAEYSPFRYMGRGENFYTYNGFTREISFNFKIAAQSRDEMQVLYRKLNYLLSQLYPDYQQFVGGATTGFMRAPLIKLTIGDYIAYQPGFIKGLSLTIPDDAPWEIANNQIPGADVDMYQLPHIIEASCQFTPIHDFLPRRSWIGGDNQPRITPLITPNEGSKGNKFGIGKL